MSGIRRLPDEDFFQPTHSCRLRRPACRNSTGLETEGSRYKKSEGEEESESHCTDNELIFGSIFLTHLIPLIPRMIQYFCPAKVFRHYDERRPAQVDSRPNDFVESHISKRAGTEYLHIE